MVKYNPLYVMLGNISQLAGLGTAAYGLFTQDIETIAGGVAMSYIGRNMISNTLDAGRNLVQERRNDILENNPTLKDKVE